MFLCSNRILKTSRHFANFLLIWDIFSGLFGLNKAVIDISDRFKTYSSISSCKSISIFKQNWVAFSRKKMLKEYYLRKRMFEKKMGNRSVFQTYLFGPSNSWVWVTFSCTTQGHVLSFSGANDWVSNLNHWRNHNLNLWQRKKGPSLKKSAFLSSEKRRTLCSMEIGFPMTSISHT